MGGGLSLNPSSPGVNNIEQARRMRRGRGRDPKREKKSQIEIFSRTIFHTFRGSGTRLEKLPIYSNPRMGSGEKIGPYTLSILLYRSSYEVIILSFDTDRFFGDET